MTMSAALAPIRNDNAGLHQLQHFHDTLCFAVPWHAYTATSGLTKSTTSVLGAESWGCKHGHPAETPELQVAQPIMPGPVQDLCPTSEFPALVARGNYADHKSGPPARQARQRIRTCSFAILGEVSFARVAARAAARRVAAPRPICLRHGPQPHPHLQHSKQLACPLWISCCRKSFSRLCGSTIRQYLIRRDAAVQRIPQVMDVDALQPHPHMLC